MEIPSSQESNEPTHENLVNYAEELFKNSQNGALNLETFRLKMQEKFGKEIKMNTHLDAVLKDLKDTKIIEDLDYGTYGLVESAQ